MSSQVHSRTSRRIHLPMRVVLLCRGRIYYFTIAHSYDSGNLSTLLGCIKRRVYIRHIYPSIFKKHHASVYNDSPLTKHRDAIFLRCNMYAVRYVFAVTFTYLTFSFRVTLVFLIKAITVSHPNKKLVHCTSHVFFFSF